VKPLTCRESPGTRFVPSICLESRVPGTQLINEPRVNWMVLKGVNRSIVYTHMAAGTVPSCALFYGQNRCVLTGRPNSGR
jgi:hypothetical protein